MSLERCLQHIIEEGTPLSYPALIELSDLTPAELGRVARTWFKMPTEHKQKVMERLVEMAEDNAELDFSAVFKMCLKDADELIRQKAINGLWEFEDRSLMVSLVEILKGDDSGQVRAVAAMAMGKFASLAQDGKILSRDGELVKGSLMKALRDDNEWLEVRRRALEAVAPFNSPDVNKYVHWAYDSDDLNLKSSSLHAMGKTGEPQWLPLLVRELQNPSPPIRYEAANACGELDEEEAAPHLIPLLQDDDFQVQLATIGALGGIGGSLAERALRNCLKKGDPILEDAARSALENIQATEEPLGFNYEVD